MKRTQPWFVGAALRAISQNVCRTTQVFSERDVAGWDAAFEEKTGMVSIAMERLLHHEMVVRCEPPENARRKLIKLDARWRLTTKGLGTCRSVARALPNAAPPDPKALSTRLWELFRQRKILTAEKAAELLIDAGTRDFANAQRQIAGYLRAWSINAPDFVKVSAKRDRGHKRYVMETDGGIYPPPTKSTGIKPMPFPRSHAPVESLTVKGA